MRVQTQSKITVWLFLSLLGTGLEPILVKYFALPVSPMALIGLKSLIGGLLMLPFYGRLRGLSSAKAIPIVQVALLALVTNGLLFVALSHIPTTVLITLCTTTPLIVGLANHKRGREDVSLQFLVAFCAVLVGVAMSIGGAVVGANTVSIIGAGIAFLSVLTSAAYRLKMDILTQQVDPLTVSAGIFAVNGLLSMCYLPVIGFPMSALPLAIWLAFAGVVANIAFLYAIKHLGSTRVSMLSLIQRPLAVIFGAFLLHEIITIPQMVGMGLVFVGIYLSKVRRLVVKS